MSSIQAFSLPADALLQRYVASGAYTDCFVVSVEGQISLAHFMAAFYTTPVFKVERFLLARLMNFPSTDKDAQLLAFGQITQFSAWHIESRLPNQVILAAGRTRSWLMVAPMPDTATTTLFFGSAVVQRKRGGLGWLFNTLLGFHKLYSRVLLASAVSRLAYRNA